MEPETEEGRNAALKRAREEYEEEAKLVKPEDRIKKVWEYLDNVKKLQELEIQADLIRKKIRILETRTPDLKGLRGNVEHLSDDTFYAVRVGEKERVVPGKSYQEALEKYQKKLDQDKKNAAKQKAEAEAKKKKV